MRLIRGLGGSVLWIVSGLLGLVSILLCVTIILLPLGIPLLGLARRLMTAGARLMLPPSVAHPVKQSRKGLRARGKDLGDSASSASSTTLKGGRRGRKNVEAMAERVGKQTKRKSRRLRKSLG